MRGGFNAGQVKLLVLHGLYFNVSNVAACVCNMPSSNCIMRCFVELHVPNVFGQCLNDRIFVKRRFLLYLCLLLEVLDVESKHAQRPDYGYPNEPREMCGRLGAAHI